MYTHLLTAHTGSHNHTQVAHALANEYVFCLLNTSCRRRDTRGPKGDPQRRRCGARKAKRNKKEERLMPGNDG